MCRTPFILTMVKDTINWAVGTGVTLAVAGKVLNMIPTQRRRKKKRKTYNYF